MGFGMFVNLWLRRAFTRSISLGDLAGSLIGNGINVFLQFNPDYAPVMKDLIWQIPVYAMAGAMAYRLLIAPYELWKEAGDRVSLLTADSSPESEAARAYEIEKARQRAIDDANRERQNTQLNHAMALIEGRRDADNDFAVRPSIRARMDQRFPEVRRKFEAILANPIPNITMKEALQLIAAKAKKEGETGRDELQDLASIGAVAVWGRAYVRKDPNPLVAIPASAWANHFMFLWTDSKIEADHEGITQHGTGFAHRDLRFCKEQLIDHYSTRR
jgi:hypothetical protein